MVGTYLLYIFLLIVVWLFSLIARKTNDKRVIYLIILFLTFFSGMRGQSVGIDTKNYIELFDIIADGNFEYAYGLEEGFKYFSFVILTIFQSKTILLLIISTITNICIVLRAWDFKNIASFEWIIVCYYISFYFMTMNIMRQFCAVAIVFYFTRLLNKDKYILFFCLVVTTGVFIHKTALLGLVFLFIEVVRWEVLSTKQKYFLKRLLLLLPVLVFLGAVLLKDKFGYFSDENVVYKFGLMLFIKFLFIIVTCIVIIPKTKYLNIYYDFLCVKIYYLLGTILSCLGYMFPYMERVGLYFYVFEGIYIGMIMKNFGYYNKFVFGSIVAFLFGYIFVMSLIGNSQGVMPYTFM